ncbi:hypothetical protein ABOM_000335 [Aspergillus bombycis]|uniref:Uncharacterized protein n=1 Tax=Aspergillus bombycis TaxID=109264 RepID=A0A1F8AIG9_9EURO|nr:hypothetical protein ABOM_000335 [Aspergillus bombycis]OGM51135.1 hypothetical protein ABOM_000335 [Aspergillus bombycis]
MATIIMVTVTQPPPNNIPGNIPHPLYAILSFNLTIHSTITNPPEYTTHYHYQQPEIRMTQFHPISFKSLRRRLSRHSKPSTTITVSSSEISEAETQTVKPIIRRKSAKEIRKAVIEFLEELGGAVRATPIDEDYGRCDCGRCFGRCFGRTPQSRYGPALIGRDLDDTLCLLRSRPVC